MIKRISLLILLALSACAHRPAGEGSVDAARLDAIVRSEVAQGFSGTVLVAQGERILLLRGYGELSGVPMQPRTRYWISSMGKQFVSAAILMLRDEGKLSLDDPVAQWFPDAPAATRPITVLQLLSHTSGLPQGYLGEEASSNEEAARRILAAAPVHAPGQRFLYSNDNYQLAAAIVERASGIGYRDFVHQRLLAPLGLRDSGVANGPVIVAPSRNSTPPRLLQPQWGIEGHYATAPDLLAWFRALRSGRILRDESVRQIWAPVIAIGEGQAALGWFVSETPRGSQRIWTRGNDDFGPNSLLYAYPDSDVVIVILSHAGQKTDEISYSRALLAHLEDALRL